MEKFWGKFEEILPQFTRFHVHYRTKWCTPCAQNFPMVQSCIVYWISQNLALSPLMYYNIQYGIRFIKKKYTYISVKTEIQIYQQKKCDLDLPLQSTKKTVSTSLKIGKTSDKPQSNSKSQYLGLHILSHDIISYHIISYQYLEMK